ncbi:MAG: NADPH-dependent glutamate synthase [Promethearchaeota archaeon]
MNSDSRVGRKMSNKDRLSLPRQEMPCRDPMERIRDFKEVALGFTEDQAVNEAKRCLQCKKAPCVAGCPVGIDIKRFLEFVANGDFKGALAVILEKNNLPAVTGRVCPQEIQCEARCTLGKIKNNLPLAIGSVERFVADWNAKHGYVVKPLKSDPTGLKVAVIGSGPAGLTAAGELAKMGHDVTVYEAFHVAGGVLVYGIPEFRLPKSILSREIEFLKGLGVKFCYNTVIGKTIEIDELFEMGYRAIFIGTGAGLPRFLKVPGENLNGVYSANEFLTRVNLMKAYMFPEYDTPVKIGKHICVIGGGNVAMDSARTAARLGAEHVYLFYRRSRKEMPARHAEVEHAIEEGIDIRYLLSPVEIIGDNDGNIKAIKLQRMTLGCLDESGRARCEPIKGAFETFEVDTVIIAIGSDVNTICSSTVCGLETDSRGHVITDPTTQGTSIEGIFAAGDAVTGSATVISAMGNAKKAATFIDRYLKDKKKHE